MYGITAHPKTKQYVNFDIKIMASNLNIILNKIYKTKETLLPKYHGTDLMLIIFIFFIRIGRTKLQNYHVR